MNYRELKARCDLVNGINVELRRRIAEMENRVADLEAEEELLRAELARERNRQRRGQGAAPSVDQ